MSNSSWEIIDYERPWTMNSERQWHYHKRARMVKDVRERFHWLALEQKIPKLERITVDATPLLKSKNAVPDVGACYPSVKAAIDGLVDARIIPDDDYKCVVRLAFHAPEFIDKDGLKIVIEEI